MISDHLFGNALCTLESPHLCVSEDSWWVKTKKDDGKNNENKTQIVNQGSKLENSASGLSDNLSLIL